MEIVFSTHFNHIFKQDFFLKIMVKQTLIAFLIIPVYGFFTPIFGQKAVTIKLNNPSFEDEPSPARTPKGWSNCGFDGESPPDVQISGAFGCSKHAFNGQTYMGLVVRDNGTWEAVGQKLKKPLLKDIKYSFSIRACQSENYISMSRLTGDSANYTMPAVIKVWGSDSSLCERKELLAQSQPIDFRDWKKLKFTLSPKNNYSYFMIEAYYIKVLKYAYNGNILVDKLSKIVPILDKN